MSLKDWIRFSVLGLIWGTSFLWIKIAVGEISPWVLVGFRALIGACSLFVYLVITKSPAFGWKNLRSWLGIFMVVGLINIAIPFLLISWSEQFIPSGIASILNSSVPLFSLVLAPLFLQDDQGSLPKRIGMGFGFLGIVLIFLPSIKGGLSHNLIGMGAMLLAALSYAAAGIYTRRWANGLPSEIQAFLQLATATGMVWVVTLLVERPVRLPSHAITWVALLWLGILGSGLAYLFYFSLLHSIGPTRTTIVTYIPPLVGILLGAAFLSEQITWEAVLGGLMVISGIAVVNLKRPITIPWSPRRAGQGHDFKESDQD